MTRTDVLNALADAFDLKDYLEIGVGDGRNIAAVRCPFKVGVDPSPLSPTGLLCTSDTFFSREIHHYDVFDLIFVDGDHHDAQVARDVQNSWRLLRRGGFLVMHDVLPDTELLTAPSKCGTVYRVAVALSKLVDVAVIPDDYGVLVANKKFDLLPHLWGIWQHVTWQEYERWRETYLDLWKVAGRQLERA